MQTTAELKTDFLHRAMTLDLEPKVLMDGRIDAEIVIIGEGPGQKEIDGKMAFIGPSGNMLWNTLRQHGILRPQCYVTNVVKRQISLAKDARDPVLSDEMQKWTSLLHWELSHLKKPKYILALGNAALSALHGWKGIGKYRGSVYSLPITTADGKEYSSKVLYAFNPAAVLRTPTDEIVFQMDAKRFSDLTKGDYVPYEVKTHFDLSYAQTLDVLKMFVADKKRTSVDIEMTSLALACVGLANDPHEAFCLNLRDFRNNRFSIQEEADIMLALQDLYNNPDIEFVAQNGGFDSHWQGFHDRIKFRVDYDTMLAHHTLYPSLPHNLGFLTSQYTTLPYYKDEISLWKEDGDIRSFWDYNGKDCCVTLTVANKTEKELKAQGLYDFFKGHVMRLQPHLVTSTVEGIKVDLAAKDRVRAKLEVDLDKKLKRFHHCVQVATGVEDYSPNPNSAPQLKKLLYNHLNLKHRSGSTDDNARSAMLEDARTSIEAKEVITALNAFKKDYKFFSTYVETKLDPDNRMRCDWKQHGVVSAPGRLSSSKTLWDTGMNLQNQPPAAREFFIADEDCVMIYFDLAQAEARVVGYVADIEKWKEDFERGRQDGSYDCHRALAADMFNKPYEDIPKEDEIDGEYTLRYISKRCRHGLNYRMQIARLAETTGLSYSRAAIAYHAYHKTSPEVQKWWDATTSIVKKERQLFNAYGRRWKVLQRIDDDALKSIVAFYPQSTIGDKVARVWFQAHEDDRWDHHKARIRINVHDALIGIAHKDYAKTALSIMLGYAEEPIMITNIYRTKTEPLIIPADGKISVADEYGLHRWSTLKGAKDVEPAKI